MHKTRTRWVIRIWADYKGVYSVQAISGDTPQNIPGGDPYTHGSLYKARCEARRLLDILDFGAGRWVRVYGPGGGYFWCDDTAVIEENRPFL